MKKYLLCIASFEGEKQIFFDMHISPRNKEFAFEQGYEYIEIKEKQSFRNSGTWLKLYNVKKLIDSNFVKEGDHITIIDADICLVDSRYPLISDKPFTYAIDSCNTHCMGYYSIKVCDWSIRFINELLSEENYLRNGDNDFWRMWAEQSSFYYITGIQRHSDIPFFELPNFGFGLENRPETIYTPEELLENIEIRNSNYNVTYVLSEIDHVNTGIERYYINKNNFKNIIIRHWAGGQIWNERYFQIPLKKMQLNVDRVYITHWSKLTNRKEWLVNHLNERNINSYDWVEKYDKDDWSIEDIKIDYPLVFDLNPKGRNLKLSEISLVLKHCWIIKDAFQKQYDSILILEDDVVLEDDFVLKFNSYVKQLPSDWDICWVGSCCNLHSKSIPGINVYREKSSRCTHAYIVSKSCINKIIESIKFVNDGADWYYNSLIEKLNLNNYWFEPSLASQNSIYETTIQNN